MLLTIFQFGVSFISQYRTVVFLAYYVDFVLHRYIVFCFFTFIVLDVACILLVISV